MAKGKYRKWLEPDSLKLLEGWARQGLTDKQIAKKAGINPDTLYTWKAKYPEISEALKRSKEIVDTEVENALLKRAMGYSTTEEVQEARYNPETGKYELVTTKRTVKEVPPDTTAQIFWLKNRRPDLWRDRQNVELSGKVESVNPYEGLTTAQLVKLATSAGSEKGVKT